MRKPFQRVLHQAETKKAKDKLENKSATSLKDARCAQFVYCSV
jgi:hypothetical protein